MLADYAKTSFTHDGKTKPVYVRGEGRAVIVLHELPGITPQVLRFAGWVVDAGFRAYLPELTGVAGKPFSTGYYLRVFAGVCISREFALLAAHRSSAVTDWLRALARQAARETAGAGVGVVGMCFTGNFALAMMLEPCLAAAVTAQPSLPLSIGSERRAALHLSAEELHCLKERCARGDKVLGLRFESDQWCQAPRFDTLRRELGQSFEEIALDPAAANPDSPNPHAHSVLTNDLIDRDGEPTKEAAKRVIAFLKVRLNPSPTAGARCLTPIPAPGRRPGAP
jgi:dienelactone hydrolase